MNPPQPSAIDTTRRLLGRLRPLFDQATRALAEACSVDGRLDATRLDARQIESFELAWASADLLAAETVMASLAADASTLDRQLALVFAVEAIASVCQRLEALTLDLRLDVDLGLGLGPGLGPLQAIAADPAWALLRRAATGAQALAAAGLALAQSASEIGPVALDGPLQLAQDTFRRFAAEVVAPRAQAIHRQDSTVPETLLAPLREMGVFGLSIPERYGGSAPDDRDDALMMLVVTEALSEASLAAAGSLITRPEILSRALLAGGTAAQKARWLPRIAAGDPLCAIAITEPDHGSDVAGLMLKGTPTEGGWLLNGAKTWCTFAGKAGLLMVVTRTDPDRTLGHRGLSLLLVEKPSHDGHAFEQVQTGTDRPGAPPAAHPAAHPAAPPGAHPPGRLTGQAIPTIGYRGMHSFDLSFENFFVPDANVIGERAGLGQGFYFTMAGMVGGRMQTAARASGVMRAALRAALQYAADRWVFGAALIDHPLTLAKLARMAARYAACRQLTYAIAQRMNAGQTGPDRDGRVAASQAKLLACRSAEWVTREALQIHGGMGYAEESQVSRLFVDARVLSIFEGAEETLALKVIARGLLDAALAAPNR